MSTNVQHRQDLKPPPPDIDEGYWTSLLHEGEFVGSAAPDAYTENRKVTESEGFAKESTFAIAKSPLCMGCFSFLGRQRQQSADWQAAANS